MAWYPDLSPCDYFGKEYRSGLRAVGWLEKGHEYSRGEVPEDLVAKLVDLFVNPWQPGVFMGFHTCGFCKPRFNQLRQHGFMYKNSTVPLWVNNLFVPGEGFLYVAPSGILHYLDLHEYAPPDAFARAVMACPPMRSLAYLKTLRANAPQGLVRERHGSRKTPTS
jgi:hypothetical protein